MKKMLFAAAIATMLWPATPAHAETLRVPVSVDGRSVKYVVLFFSTPVQGKRTVVTVKNGKVQIPEGFAGFRGYCLVDSGKNAIKCIVK